MAQVHHCPLEYRYLIHMNSYNLVECLFYLCFGQKPVLRQSILVPVSEFTRTLYFCKDPKLLQQQIDHFILSFAHSKNDFCHSSSCESQRKRCSGWRGSSYAGNPVFLGSRTCANAKRTTDYIDNPFRNVSLRSVVAKDDTFSFTFKKLGPKDIVWAQR